MCMLLPLICWKGTSEYPCATAMNRNFSTAETLFRHCPVLYGPVLWPSLTVISWLLFILQTKQNKSSQMDHGHSLSLHLQHPQHLWWHQGPSGSIPLLGDAASTDLLGKSICSVRLILLQSFWWRSWFDFIFNEKGSKHSAPFRIAILHGKMESLNSLQEVTSGDE